MGMHRLRSLALSFVVISAAVAQYPNDGSPLGINLHSPSDFSTQIPWHDMFMWFRGWEKSTDGYGGFPADQLDPNGWVTRLDPGQEAWVGHGSGTQGHFPGGDYLLTWEGEGVLGPRNSCTFVEYDAVNKHAVVRVDSTGTWFGVKITQTNPSDYVRNMHMYMPGFWDPATYQLEPPWQNDPWHPDFIEMLERFKCIRFLNWSDIGNPDITQWSHIKPATFWNQSNSDAGVYGNVSPLWMIRLCNRLHADGWFCLPHRASDNLLREYAALIRDSLDPGLKAYIEYANECWNWAGPWANQTGYCRDKSVELGIGQGPAEGYAILSAHMWSVFEEVFSGQTDRLVKVLAAQSDAYAFKTWMFPYLTDLQYNPTGSMPDVLAIAPYFSDHSMPISTMSHDAFFDSVINRVLPEKRDFVQTSFENVASLNVPLITYEGGQHFVGSGTQSVDYYVAANQHPRMKEAYLQYLQDWFDLGGGLFMQYASCGLGGQYGSWGAKEYYNQPRVEAPKWDALMTFIEDSVGFVGTVRHPAVGSRMTVPAPDTRAPSAVYVLSGRLVEMLVPLHRTSVSALGANASGIYIWPKRTTAPRLRVR